MATSIDLARGAAAALRLPESTLRLQMKVLAAAGAISFKGYGRSAAAMTTLDAARLVIAVAASYFAKDSAKALGIFARLRPTAGRGRGLVLEEFLADVLDEYRHGGSLLNPEDAGRRSNLAAEASLKVMWVGGDPNEQLPRVAVVRWFRQDGGADSATFASIDTSFRFVDEARIARYFPDAGLIHARTITARALREVAEALRTPGGHEGLPEGPAPQLDPVKESSK